MGLLNNEQEIYLLACMLPPQWNVEATCYSQECNVDVIRGVYWFFFAPLIVLNDIYCPYRAPSTSRAHWLPRSKATFGKNLNSSFVISLFALPIQFSNFEFYRPKIISEKKQGAYRTALDGLGVMSVKGKRISFQFYMKKALRIRKCQTGFLSKGYF